MVALDTYTVAIIFYCSFTYLYLYIRIKKVYLTSVHSLEEQKLLWWVKVHEITKNTGANETGRLNSFT